VGFKDLKDAIEVGLLLYLIAASAEGGTWGVTQGADGQL
jgi:hypothetical protein